HTRRSSFVLPSSCGRTTLAQIANRSRRTIVSQKKAPCPYCGDEPEADRRDFLRYAAAAAGILPLAGLATAKPEEKKSEEKKPSESLVKLLFESLNAQQKKEVCFTWD